MTKFLSKAYLVYILKFGGLFSLFYFGTLIIIGLSSKENIYSPFVENYLDFVTPLRRSLLSGSAILLRLFGYSPTFSDEYTLGLNGGLAVRMVYSCVGYGVLSFWGAFILANHGSITKKLTWLVSGW